MHSSKALPRESSPLRKAGLRESADRRTFNSIGYVLITLLSLFCLLPFILIISGSFTSQASIMTDGYQLIPREFSLEAYEFLFEAPDDILRAYGVTIFVTVVGTLVSLLVTSMAAYVLANKAFRYRNTVSFFFYFTTVFGGGLVPWYIFNIKYLHFKDNLISLIYESAHLDGAGDWTIYWKIALPLNKAGLATVGLFTALNYWNDWYNAMLYIDNSKLYPLQYYLNDILNKSQGMMAAAAQAGIPAAQVPTEPVKLAMTVVATGPILLLYPFLQKYFVKGVTIGAVKG